MKTAGLYLLGVALLGFVFLCGGDRRVFAAPASFNRALTIGSSGEDVRSLQKILNEDISTRISGAGPGSPGQETTYFGSLTQNAVIRFQEKYASEVLAPAGLAQGSGYVGLYTILKLNALSALAANAGDTGTPAVTSAVASTTSSQNPNLQNLDTFLADINTVATKKGLSVAAIATIQNAVVKEAATTTNLRAAFLKSIPTNSGSSAMNTSLGDKMLATIGQMLNTIFGPQRARAATTVPFGGPLVYAFFCSCSDTWLLTLGPLPPTDVTLLTYVPFTQGFLSYNIPVTNWLLGEYVPGAGACFIPTPFGCPEIPAEGMITPMVGSSPS